MMRRVVTVTMKMTMITMNFIMICMTTKLWTRMNFIMIRIKTKLWTRKRKMRVTTTTTTTITRRERRVLLMVKLMGKVMTLLMNHLLFVLPTATDRHG